MEVRQLLQTLFSKQHKGQNFWYSCKILFIVEVCLSCTLLRIQQYPCQTFSL